jgi:putative sigma-54 modulation protein
MDVVYDKLNVQLRKYKTRMKDRHQHNKTIRYEGEGEENLLTPEGMNSDDYNDYHEEDVQEVLVQRRKKFDMKPMSEEEAILQMDLLGHDFYAFRHLETEDLTIVYKRKSGGYGIIENE